MIETLAYYLCVLGFAGFGHKLVTARHTQPVRRMWFLSGFGICIALGILVLTPAMERLAGPGTLFDRFVMLAGDDLKLGAIAFAVAFVRSMRVGDHAGLGWHAVLSLIVLPGQIVLYVLSAPHRVEPFTVFSPGTVPFAVAYELVFLGYGLLSLGVLTLILARFARQAEPGPLRTGLWLVVAGVLAGAAWTSWDLDDLRQILAAAKLEAREDLTSAILGTCCVGLVVAGVTLSVWGPSLTALTRRVRAYRYYRRIEPLWRALHAAVPGIALDPGPGGGAEFALYRRVIEIRDGQLALRPYFDPALPARAEAEALAAGIPEPRIAATIEAATLAAAILADRAGHRYRADRPGDPDTASADVLKEAAWLAQVSRAWDSDIVGRIRTAAERDLPAARWSR